VTAFLFASHHTKYITAYNIQKPSKRPLYLLASLAHPSADKEMVAVRDLCTPPISALYGYRTGSIISIRRNGPETETKYSNPTIVWVIVNRQKDMRETDPTGWARSTRSSQQSVILPSEALAVRKSLSNLSWQSRDRRRRKL
jgi:hypothetical protein